MLSLGIGHEDIYKPFPQVVPHLLDLERKVYIERIAGERTTTNRNPPYMVMDFSSLYMHTSYRKKATQESLQHRQLTQILVQGCEAHFTMLGSVHVTKEVRLILATLLAILCRSDVGINNSAHDGNLLLLDNQSLKAGLATPYAST
jgi:hypothetical protein